MVTMLKPPCTAAGYGAVASILRGDLTSNNALAAGGGLAAEARIFSKAQQHIFVVAGLCSASNTFGSAARAATSKLRESNAFSSHYPNMTCAATPPGGLHGQRR